ncbi:hypothetical protein SPBR_08669 [Sporothrix brasiliensis 5110]|uniref:Uncharacterized protein n=1 Tax=Sporothrix brasiliensis 5110 TaxID=1398154 RepID=A0A0C2F606_9PEZI|nr:uncharacterized protein SPBR_08669 [Sporothrix brasiliensis 5110]KIH86458.1 hypothetical protein SPBR_08669 [Sporothrix brasiliensis 5110]
MDKATTSRDSAQSGDRSSQSTDTFSVPSSSGAIPSTVVAPKASHLRAEAAPTNTAAVSSTAAPTVSRWSDGTFGSAAGGSDAPSTTSGGSGPAGSLSTYSGKSAQATTAQAATATVVDLGAARQPQHNAGSTNRTPYQAPKVDSSQVVAEITNANPVYLKMVLSSEGFWRLGDNFPAPSNPRNVN